MKSSSLSPLPTVRRRSSFSRTNAVSERFISRATSWRNRSGPAVSAAQLVRSRHHAVLPFDPVGGRAAACRASRGSTTTAAGLPPNRTEVNASTMTKGERGVGGHGCASCVCRSGEIFLDVTVEILQYEGRYKSRLSLRAAEQRRASPSPPSPPCSPSLLPFPPRLPRATPRPHRRPRQDPGAHQQPRGERAQSDSPVLGSPTRRHPPALQRRAEERRRGHVPERVYGHGGHGTRERPRAGGHGPPEPRR